MHRHYYSEELLLAAAAESTCMSELLQRLDAEATPGRRRHLWYRLRKSGVDLSHWQRSPHRWYSTERLAEAVAASTSYAGVLRHLGVPQAGGSQAYLARRIRSDGLDTSHFTGQAYMRGATAPQRLRPEQVLVVRPTGSRRVSTPLLRRVMLESGVPLRCAVCGLGAEWQGQPLTLVIDHVNGDWLDNRLPNLRFLCPNCHAQTATWCRKKGP
ncbi:MAG: hypothetical protein JWM62_3112 [Frankiales bacterium]|nr:hypothetical protein [Frankiales bacterium]